jgi:2-C-methyl-D-erythritol 4-phosphate cytidylyltransferase
MPKFAVILPAAGQSSRFESAGGDKKPFVMLDDAPVFLHAVRRFAERDDVVAQKLVVPPADLAAIERRFGTLLDAHGVELVGGGDSRAASVACGLAAIDSGVEWIIVHDAVRPCVDLALIDRALAAATVHGAAIPAVPITSTIKQSADGVCIDATVSRDGLWLAQTPQVFERRLLQRALAASESTSATDDAQLIERIGHEVRLVAGSPLNIKITTHADLLLATAILQAQRGERCDTPLDAKPDTMWR